MRDVTKFTLLDIKCDCFETLVASFSNWIKGEYRFLFCECLGFEWVKDNLCIGKRIKVKKGNIIEHAVENGLVVDFHIDVDESKLKYLLKSFTPIILEIDTYDCYWRDSYKKLHESHYVIAWDIDVYSKSIVCTDTFPRKDNLKIDYGFILNTAKRAITIIENVKEFQFYSPQKCISKLVSNINRSDEARMLNQMKKFIQEFPNLIDLAQEMYGYESLEIFYIPIVSNLKKISWSFYQFQYLLKYVSDIKLDDCYCLADDIIKSFEFMANYIILRILRKENIVQTSTLLKYLRKVFCKEEILVKNLLEYCKSYENSSYYTSL